MEEPRIDDCLIRILIVDDHPVVCTGLTSMLSEQVGIAVVGAASSGEEALETIERIRPSVVLLDLRLPGIDGIGVLAALKRFQEVPKVLVLTSFEKEEEIYRAIKAGADGYLLKDASKAEMMAAIAAVVAGKRYIPRDVAARLADRMMRPALTARELQILDLLAEGATNKQIASALGISDNTVRNHVINIMNKLHASDRTEAVVAAIRSGILAWSD